jgi:shikimate kinase
MGSGKSTVGIRLSYKMAMTVVDTDKLIEREQHKTISDIFSEEGEEAFRQMETDCIGRSRITARSSRSAAACRCGNRTGKS